MPIMHNIMVYSRNNCYFSSLVGVKVRMCNNIRLVFNPFPGNEQDKSSRGQLMIGH